MAKQTSGLRRWRANVLLAAASLVVFCGAIELGVRLLRPDLSLPQAEHHFRFTQEFEFALPHHRRDPVLGWRLVPGTYGKMHVNQHGFRGREFGPAARGLRIAHLGDSCTMGFGIPADADVYPARLETLLQEAGIACETMNFGVDGYSSHQGRLLLGPVLESFKPRYVTIYFGYNDHHYANASDAEARFASGRWRSLLERSHAYRWLRRVVLLSLGRRAELREPKRRVAPDAFAANLRAIARAARQNGATPIFMTTPLRPDVPLIENEVQAAVDGRETWVTQDWWLARTLESSGLQLPADSGKPAVRRALEAAILEHPTWPYLHWVQARELHAAGEIDAARAALARARQLDAERQTMSTYNDRVRDVAASEAGVLLDLEQAFTDAGSPFIDVVHPNGDGHRRIAALLAKTLVQLQGGAPSSSPVPPDTLGQ
jgi:lysophospholipase L1-like esterase